MTGLAVAADYEAGQKMIRDRSFQENAEFFATVFEIGRRHKILNPECMRTGHTQICLKKFRMFFIVRTSVLFIR
jgi:hypothetical protein